ncbi:hypothetical protein AB0A69_07465 [Streptomyces sp. NPDC045431]|uniref:hypothetical protein n=1 Tax=Streptomyces sp. NPDC045431 TaxID=3155613 RepID=UPI0033C9F7B8
MDAPAKVIPLHERDRGPKVEVQWTPEEQSDPGAYRKLLELLFLPRTADDQAKAA